MKEAFVGQAMSTLQIYMVKKYELTAVYSRHLEKAQEFGSHYEGDIEFATEPVLQHGLF
ncbi:hypothetical protein EfmAA96_07930 [Enterococcus faecium]|nr:hypothetical protein EfmAA96_07930 [Enterococcus faecium]